MDELRDKVAVVTGAASGIGRALAARFARDGMKVVLADIDTAALERAAKEISSEGADVLAVRTDVANRASIDDLAAATIAHFGTPNLLCNNAGVTAAMGRPIWETTDHDWEWMVGVNLMGMIHGIQAFLPPMISSGQPGHVVNTSSIYGLMTEGGPIYGVIKHAVTRLSEGLWYNLQQVGAPIGVSVLCPGLIATNIASAHRNRPAHLTHEADPAAGAAREGLVATMHGFLQEHGMQPAEVADIVVDAIRADRFYVLTHPQLLAQVEQRFRAILGGTSPPPNTSVFDLVGRV